MFLKKRIIATAAVIAMAAAAVYGSTQEMSQTQEADCSCFEERRQSIAGIPMRHCPVISMRQQYPSENRTMESV